MIKFIWLGLLASFSSFSQVRSEFTGPRDGTVYKIVTVKIRLTGGDTVERVWFAENLKYQSVNSVCYKSDDAYCEAFGRLYDWHDAHGSCPAGWHVPNFDRRVSPGLTNHWVI